MESPKDLAIEGSLIIKKGKKRRNVRIKKRTFGFKLIHDHHLILIDKEIKSQQLMDK